MRALAETEPRPRRARARFRRVLAPAVAAVVLVALVITTVVVASDSTGDDAASDRSALEGEADESGGAAADGALPDLGEVSDPAVLRAALAAEIDLPQTVPQSESSTADAEAPASEGVDAPLGAVPEGAQPAATPEEASACADGLAEDLEATGPAVLVASGTFDGAPAVVVVLPVAGGTEVSVLSADDCGLLSSQFFVDGE